MKWKFRKGAESDDKSVYNYYVVEHSFVARIEKDNKPLVAERLMEDGTWAAYSDVWDVCTNGRCVDSEDKALAEFEAIMALRKKDESE